MTIIEIIALRRLESLKNEIAALHMSLFNQAQKSGVDPVYQKQHNRSLQSKNAEFDAIAEALYKPEGSGEHIKLNDPPVAYRIDTTTGKWYLQRAPTVVGIYTDKAATEIFSYMDVKRFGPGFEDLLLDGDIKMLYWDQGNIKALRINGEAFYPEII